LKVFYYRYIVAAMTVFCLAGTALQAAEPVKIAVFPFTIHAEKDYDYLKAGVVDMLTSRLTYGDRIVVIDKAETAAALERALTTAVDEDAARDIAGQLGAHYALIGSMTVFGTSISMDIKVIDVSGRMPVRTFFKQSQGMDGVIPGVNAVAADINAQVFGRTPVNTSAAASQPAEKVDAVHAHPEKLLEDSVVEDETDPAAGMPAPIVSGELPRPDEAFWKSRTFEIVINGLAVGDVDGDGNNETVIVAPDTLTIFKNEQGRFYKFKEIESGGFSNFVAVDVGDINGNGVDEIFATGLTTARTGADSNIYEFDGTEMRLLEEGTYYKYRVVRQKGNRLVLMAQELRPHQPNLGPVYAMIWAAGGYETDERLISLRTLDVLGMSYGDIMNTGKNCFVAHTTADRLRVIKSSGEVMWASQEHYGGSSLYYSRGRSAPGEEEYAYFPVRVIHADTNQDGLNEVVAVKNYEMLRRALQNFRVYTDAHFESFSWDGLGLAANWKTRKFSGGVRDYAIADFDNDGQNELVAAVLLKDKHIIGMTPKSTIIAFELERLPE